MTILFTKLVQTNPNPKPSTDRMSSTLANRYSQQVTYALRVGACNEPAHKSSHLILAANRQIMEEEERHFNAAQKQLFSANLRELGTILLANLFRVPKQNSLASDPGAKLLPKTHFLQWLGGLKTTTARIFNNPQQAQRQDEPLYGRAKLLTFGNLTHLLRKLRQATDIANANIHGLNVESVVWLLNSPIAIEQLGEPALSSLIALVEYILGWSIAMPNRADFSKSFKFFVKEFRQRDAVENTAIIDRIENEWRGQYQTALIHERTLELIKRGLVVSRDDYDDLQKSHNDLQKSHNDLQKSNNDLQKSHNDLQKSYNDLQKSNNDLQEKYNNVENELKETKKELKEVKNTLERFMALIGDKGDS